MGCDLEKEKKKTEIKFIDHDSEKYNNFFLSIAQTKGKVTNGYHF